MAPGATLGAGGPELGPRSDAEDRANALNMLLDELRDNARQRGYPYALLHAATVPGIEVYLIERTVGDHTQRLLVNQADKMVMVDGLNIGHANLRVRQSFLARFPGYVVRQQVPGSPVPVAVVPGEPTVHEARDEPGRSDRGQWTLVRQVHDGSRTLLLDPQAAMDLGLVVTDRLASVDDMQRYLNTGPDDRVRVRQTWSESLAEWLTRPGVRLALVVLLIVGMFIEMQTVGVGLGAALAGIALLGLLGGPLVLGLAEVWHLVLFFLGVALIIVELFIVPGFGFAGVAGLLCVVIGLVLMVVPTAGGGPMPLPADGTAGVLRTSILTIVAGLTLGFLTLVMLARYYGSIPFLERMVLKSEDAPDQALGDEDDTVPIAPPGLGAAPPIVSQLRIGDRGTVTTALRPSGLAMIGNHTVDVASAGSWIERGQPVRIIEIEGNRVVVEPDNPADAAGPTREG
jgi:membrane-bound serine protease (ClpP class)